MEWRSDMENAPQNVEILVWFDHDADPYQDASNPERLTDYAAWADSGDYLAGSGIAIAKWFPQFLESTDEYGSGYFMPAAWFCREYDDYERVCNPTHWMPLPSPPVQP